MTRALTRMGSVTVIAFGRASEERDAAALATALGQKAQVRLVEPVSRFAPWRLALGLIGSLPFLVVAERSRQFRRFLSQELGRAQAGVVLCTTVAMYDQLKDTPDCPLTVIDTHNIDSLVLARYAQSMPRWHQRWYAGVTARKLQHFERKAFRAAAAVVVCSGVERELLEHRMPGLEAWVIPNGAEVDRFERREGIARVPGRMFFFGRLDYHPNRDAIEYFLDQIFPLIQAQEPGAEFHVAGAGCSEALRRLLTGTKGVVLHGRVDDLGALLATASVVVVPLRAGGGTRLKILEALAAACPVVSTTLGAEGLDLRSGRELLLADGALDFAAAVIGLLRDPVKALALGVAGSGAVRQQYDWRAIEETFSQRVNQLKDARSGGA